VSALKYCPLVCSEVWFGTMCKMLEGRGSGAGTGGGEGGGAFEEGTSDESITS